MTNAELDVALTEAMRRHTLAAFSTDPAACAKAKSWARQQGWLYTVAWTGEGHSVAICKEHWETPTDDLVEREAVLDLGDFSVAYTEERAFAEALLAAIESRDRQHR